MLLSLAIILVPVMLIVWFFTRTPDEPNIHPVFRGLAPAAVCDLVAVVLFALYACEPMIARG